MKQFVLPKGSLVVLSDDIRGKSLNLHPPVAGVFHTGGMHFRTTRDFYFDSGDIVNSISGLDRVEEERLVILLPQNKYGEYLICTKNSVLFFEN